tara:strand:- start:931 stop:1518 length:588 start_codon:yes stop_codon:yes gene_type:complete
MALNPSITDSLLKQSSKIVRVEVQKQFKKSFEIIKNRMITEFLQHPVTVELKGGIRAKNISGTLSGGSGNLFSFIGFDAGEDPIDPIENILRRTNVTFSGLRSKSVEFTIDIPTPAEIFAVTPMPWASGRSWAKGIETGISGLGYYLRKESDLSRSGLGIQTSAKVRKTNSRFKNTKYISNILKKYKKEFEDLQL